MMEALQLLLSVCLAANNSLPCVMGGLGMSQVQCHNMTFQYQLLFEPAFHDQALQLLISVTQAANIGLPCVPLTAKDDLDISQVGNPATSLK